MAMLPATAALRLLPCCLLAVLASDCHKRVPKDCPADITIDGQASALRFDGIGAISARATSRLLYDYAEPTRSAILDFLFLPKFGASLQMLKVEIGGDSQSGFGIEPSHRHTRDDLSCSRVRTFWLIREARLRNPELVVYALAWAWPHWVGEQNASQTEFRSEEAIAYLLSWLQCAKETGAGAINYLGNRPNRSWGPVDWMASLRGALDEAGYNSTGLVLPDTEYDAETVELASSDASFKVAMGGGAIGVHYPCYLPRPELRPMTGLPFWSTEDIGLPAAGWPTASCLGRTLNTNFLRMNVTSTIIRSMAWAVHPVLPGHRDGLVEAVEPWGGSFRVNDMLWVLAHTTQFTEVGWLVLTFQSGSTGHLKKGGTYITYVEPSRKHFTIVVEKLQSKCRDCSGTVTGREELAFTLIGGLRGAALEVNDSNKSSFSDDSNETSPTSGASEVNASNSSDGSRDVSNERVAMDEYSNTSSKSFDADDIIFVHIWLSNRTHKFIQLAPLRVDERGRFVFTAEPDTIYTISSTTGQAHGQPARSNVSQVEACPDVGTPPRGALVAYEADAEGLPEECLKSAVQERVPDYCCNSPGKFNIAGDNFESMFSKHTQGKDELVLSNSTLICAALAKNGPLADVHVSLQCNADNSITFGDASCGKDCTCTSEASYPPGCYKASNLPERLMFLKSEGCECYEAATQEQGGARPSPLPHIDFFESYVKDDTPKFFTDFGGSFQAAPDPTDPANLALKQWVAHQAGANRWTDDSEPITLIGHRLADVALSVDAYIPEVKTARLWQPTSYIRAAWAGHCLASDQAQSWDLTKVVQQSCKATVDEQFVFEIETGRIYTAASAQLCITAHTCSESPYRDEAVCTRPCGTLGSLDHSNQSWVWEEDGSLRLHARPELCLTSVRDSEGKIGGSLSPSLKLLPCGKDFPSLTQQFLAPGAELDVYAGACLRLEPQQYLGDWGIDEYAGEVLRGKRGRKGYCLRLGIDGGGRGSWRLESGGRNAAILASGPLTAPLGSWHSLRLATEGTRIRVQIDVHDEVVAVDSDHRFGAAALLSGWNEAYFDNFELNPSTSLEAVHY